MSDATAPRDFIRDIVASDLEAGRHDHVLTRFPPEPNGFLHLGHAKAICLDFGVARQFGGETTLRMDDTNPTTEDARFVDSIAEDVRWLGFEWVPPIRYASDYFEALYLLAEQLVKDGLAYVDDLPEEEMREYRGTVTEPGRPSPYRDRGAEENLDLFRRMRAGEFEDGSRVLRARVDLASPNMKMRDPLLYRVRHAHHYRTEDAWPIYPMYDWAHGQSDAIEGITHSFCTLEFENNRELYDWFLDHTRPAAARIESVPGARGGGGEEMGSWNPRPRQYEFARLNPAYTIVSKRKLRVLVEDGHVAGWDDPRMPTLAGMRRRGVPASAIRRFCDEIGVSRADNLIDIGKLEHAIRSELGAVAPRVMCVTQPLEVRIENLTEDHEELLEAPHFPRDVSEPPKALESTRIVHFTRTLYIETADFQLEPEPGFKRLAPGREVRLRHGFFIRCDDVERDPDTGEVTRLLCSYDPETRGGRAPDGRKPSGTIHWVSATHGVPVELRLYDRLFSARDPYEGVEDPLENLNPRSLEIMQGVIEPAALDFAAGQALQFERVGYFVQDGTSGVDGRPVFNRTIALKDNWRAVAESPAGPSPARAEPVQAHAGAGPSAEEEALSRVRDADEERAFKRLREEHGLDPVSAGVLAEDRAARTRFEEALAVHSRAASVAKWIVHELRGLSGDGEADVDGAALGRLAALVDAGDISHTSGKRVLERMLESGEPPEVIVEREGLRTVHDADALKAIVLRVTERHPRELERYAAGETKLFGFFVGQAMREARGAADAMALKRVLEEVLEGL